MTTPETMDNTRETDSPSSSRTARESNRARSIIRLVRILLFALLLGVCTTYTIAWSITLWKPVVLSEPTISWNHAMRDMEHKRWIPKWVSYQRYEDVGTCNRISTVDPAGDWFFEDRPTDSWTVLNRTPNSPNEIVLEHARGWPMFTTRCYWQSESKAPGLQWNDPSAHQMKLVGGLPIKTTIENGRGSGPSNLYSLSSTITVQRILSALPIIPIPLGMTICASMFGIGWLIISVSLSSPVWGRRFWRIRKRRCPDCGYSLAGVDRTRCSECGEPCTFRFTRDMLSVSRRMAIFLILINVVGLAAPVFVTCLRYLEPESIHAAVLRGDLAGVQDHVEQGTPLNTQWLTTLDDSTPLILAIRRNNLEMIDVLLEGGADPNAARQTHSMEWALKNVNTYSANVVNLDREHLVRLLLKHGGDPNWTNAWGYMAFSQILSHRISADLVLDLLDAGAQINPDFEYEGPSPLTSAIQSQYRNPEVIQLLIAPGAKLVETRPDVSSPLHAALRIGDVELAQKMINAGADINAGGYPYGRTPLMEAVFSRDLGVLEFILDVPGISPNLTESNGLTPLSLAVSTGSEQMTRTLLEHGANPNVQDNQGSTPLRSVFAEWSHVACILLEYGARPHTVDGVGRSFVDIICQWDFIDFDLLEMLLIDGVEFHPEFHKPLSFPEGDFGRFDNLSDEDRRTLCKLLLKHDQIAPEEANTIWLLPKEDQR